MLRRRELRADDRLIAGLFLAGQLILLIFGHSRIGFFQLLDLLRCTLVQLGNIFGQLRKQAAEPCKVSAVSSIRVCLQTLDLLNSRHLCGAGIAGVFCFVDALYAVFIRLLQLLPVFACEDAFRVVLVIVDFVKLFPELLLERGKIVRLFDVNHDRRAERHVSILVHEEGIDERIALIVERQLRLAVFVRDRVGVRADRVAGHIRCGFSRFAAVDLRAGNGRLCAGAETGHRAVCRDGDRKGLACLDLKRIRRDRGVAEGVLYIGQQRGVGAAVLTGVLDLLRLRPHQRQVVAVVQLEPVEVRTVTIRGAVVHLEIQIAVQIDHELIRHVKSVAESLLCHDRLNTGVGVQRQILSIREVVSPEITVVHTRRVHDRKMHGDRSGLGLQSIAGISQLLE